MYFDLHGVWKFIYNMKTYIEIFTRISTVDNHMIFLVQFEKKKDTCKVSQRLHSVLALHKQARVIFLFSEEEKRLHIFWKPPSKLCD